LFDWLRRLKRALCADIGMFLVASALRARGALDRIRTHPVPLAFHMYVWPRLDELKFKSSLGLSDILFRWSLTPALSLAGAGKGQTFGASGVQGDFQVGVVEKAALVFPCRRIFVASIDSDVPLVLRVRLYDNLCRV
jgi:hypothetical protein